MTRHAVTSVAVAVPAVLPIAGQAAVGGVPVYGYRRRSIAALSLRPSTWKVRCTEAAISRSRSSAHVCSARRPAAAVSDSSTYVPPRSGRS